MKYFLFLVSAMSLIGINACNMKEGKQAEAGMPKRFTLLDSAETGIAFRNDVPYNDSVNCYTFRNFYNGGGIGMGDINNDGLPDVYLCGNMTSNRLYLNKGQFKFEDITDPAGLSTQNIWTTGVAFADLNGDGWLDIYICKSGPPSAYRRHNELFINSGPLPDGTWSGKFTEQSKAYGLDFEGLSTHAAFFDYDNDGDLDCYLLNNSIRSVGGYDYRPGQRNTPDPNGGNRLLRNFLVERPTNTGKWFEDVTAAAGIYASAIGFGLGVTVGDYDRDGWQDLFVSNDFFERDYLYHNRGNGTFEEILPQMMPEISKGSMGADMADLNNDNFPDIFVTEMTPPDDARYKTKAAFDDWNTYSNMLKTGYHRQFGRNVLHLNRHGDLYEQDHRENNKTFGFSEIGRQAGVHFTDWSWGALLADFDNDGHKDIFVANGIGKDLLDQDYINFYADPAAIRSVLQNNPGQGIKTLIDKMPAQPIANYLFKNDGAADVPSFQNMAADWGLAKPSFSNGSAYADLDNDGDMDLVVNNINMPCFVYRNETSAANTQISKPNWLKINIIGDAPNCFGLGAKVTVQTERQTQYIEVAPMRGFESCVDLRPNFGLGSDTLIKYIQVDFLSGKTYTIGSVAPNQIITVRESDAATVHTKPWVPSPPMFAPAYIEPMETPKAEAFSEFDREPLLFQMHGGDGLKLAVADVNADGRSDFYAGGVAGQSGALYIQMPGGTFKISQQPDFQKDKNCEDTGVAFFDADGDRDMDLYIGSGGNALRPGDPALQDRLYLNDGRGHFRKQPTALPTGKPFATSCVRPADIDGDGDMDVFVGMRALPGHYGQAPTSFLLENDGKGQFRPAMNRYPVLSKLGMVTDAVWVDIDRDQDQDLVVVGDWEPIRILENTGQTLIEKTTIPNSEGWWNCLTMSDLDNDGDMDFAIGNHGLNARFKASVAEPLTLWVGDFDQNDQDETILCQYNGGQSYPVVLRNDLVKQLPMLKKKYLQYSNYQNQTIEQIFKPELLKAAQKKSAVTLSSAVLWNQGNGSFELKALPAIAQISPVYAFLPYNFKNTPGFSDLLLGGNHERCKPETGQYLASRGEIVMSTGLQQYTSFSNDNRRIDTRGSGIQLEGSVRDMVVIQTDSGPKIIILRANQSIQMFK